MLCEWRLHEKGADLNPYHDYQNFPTVICLKINHGDEFTKHPKIRYKGGKVNWIDTIDSDEFFVHESQLGTAMENQKKDQKKNPKKNHKKRGHRRRPSRKPGGNA
ncbi:hypothetical protein Tco_1569302 [Tanacetum coccineum]